MALFNIGNDPKLKAMQDRTIDSLTRAGEYVDLKESKCVTHGINTIYTGILGLWVCPDCARSAKGIKPRTVSLPYKDEEIMEITDDTPF